jgi:hypothetical protein
MSENIQPSDNHNATCLAVAWAIVSMTTPASEKDAANVAKKVREVYGILYAGKKLDPE